MTEVLVYCLLISVAMLMVTAGLLVVPVTPSELSLWRRLRVSSVRRWITKRRNVKEPLHPELTLKTAKVNLKWHIMMTGLFSMQLAWAAASRGAWWRPLAFLVFFFSVAYFVGSVVQRQKIAILVLRNRRNSIRSAG